MKKIMIVLSIVFLSLGCSELQKPAPQPPQKQSPREEGRAFVMLPVFGVPGDYYVVNTEFVSFARVRQADSCLVVVVGTPFPLETDTCNQLKSFVKIVNEKK